ncbi:MAG TPA: Coenzyme F420 hydrogenase/dehydrogenase, beta subunit C-terminal domain [Phycisphaerae bacterium]|nr:Coenzyme F420 hydrogenase/dehydrogenase, beta subunit C-terminal domain [Phycisphaerae bacterium]HNU44380.1 Coenzyme F420 hydrogenase/dehydrogenase, beta subunit C-terminal domain [Phycisphaerae bacterium]
MRDALVRGRRYTVNRFTIEEVRAFWDAAADEYVHDGQAMAATHRQRFERGFEYFRPRDGMRALNIWSRTGEAIDYFRQCAPRLELVNAEVSPRMIEKARARYPDETFITTTLASLPFADGEFDFILSLETLEHAPDPLVFLSELGRVLKPGGTLVLSCPPATAELPLRVYEALLPNHGEGPHRFPSSREVKQLLRAAGLELKHHDGTLFIPVGPRSLRRLEPLVERVVARTPLSEFGIRQFYVCERPRGGGPWQELMRQVVDVGLCTRCGTCVGVCPTGVLEFEGIDEECVPAAVRPEDCTQCGWCTAACPGARVSFAKVHATVGDAPVESVELGPLRRVRVAHACDRGIRVAGASGGVVTAVLGDLLDRGVITGAVVLNGHAEAPWRPWPRVARTREESIQAAQSKYCVTPTNVFLREVDPARDRLAVVALPCQVHALRMLERDGHPAMRTVSLIIGLYCGNQLSFGATRSFLKRHGVRDLSEVAEIRYRDGAWPGQVRCVLKDGRSFAVPKFQFNHLISSYVLDRCLLCTDLAAEGADISVGDAWGVEPEQGSGSSLVISRTERGEATMAELVSRGVLAAEEIEVERAVAMHAHGLDLKKTGSFLRLRRLARKGRPVPQYDVSAPRPSLVRRGIEVLISAHFRIMRTRLARAIVGRIPFGLVGPVYVGARTVWKSVAARKYENRAKVGETQPAGRGWWWRLLGPLLLLIMLWRVGLGPCWSAVSGADPTWFLAACAMSVPALGIKAFRWQELLRAHGFTLLWRESAGIYAAGLLAGAVTPGKVGDLAKAPLLAARGVPWGTGIAASLWDRAFDGLLLFAAGAGGVLALPTLPGRGTFALATAGAVVLALAGVVVFRRAVARTLPSRDARWWGMMTVATLAALACYFASAYCCARALALPLGVVDVVAGMAVAAVLGLLPITVAGIGTRDAAFVVIFGPRGVDAEHALALSALVLAWMLVNCVLFLAVSRWGLARRAPATSGGPVQGASAHESPP